MIDPTGNVGLGTTAPEAPLHVAEGSAGTVTANANSIAAFERSGHAYLSVLAPTNNESAILFGNPINSADGGIFYNTGVATRGLTFRTGGNSTKMVIESDGNVGIGTTTPTNRLHVNGGITCTALTETSDRNAKENFAPVSPGEVLAKVAALPITTWNFKDLRDGRHMGPMAQDFYTAFGLGGSDTTITSVDRDGVTLAAIQGLNQKVEDRGQRSEDRIQKLEAENAELKRRLERLEQLMNRQRGQIFIYSSAPMRNTP